MSMVEETGKSLSDRTVRVRNALNAKRGMAWAG